MCQLDWDPVLEDSSLRDTREDPITSFRKENPTNVFPEKLLLGHSDKVKRLNVSAPLPGRLLDKF